MDEIKFNSTAEARTECAVLDAGVAYYTNLVTELKNAKTKIEANWTGDANDITEITARLSQVISLYEAKIIVSMQGLSSSIVQFADEVDKAANADVTTGPSDPGTINNPTTGGGDTTNSGTTGNTGTTTPPDNQQPATKEELGFWGYHGKNFAEAWTDREWFDAYDFSNADGLFSGAGVVIDGTVSVIGDLLDGAVDTVGAGANFLLDGAASLVGWIFD